jgi:hypothetical protein
MLGNLKLEEIQKRAGVVFPAELIEWMSDKHQAEAVNIKTGKWHCFDMPFILVCGDRQTAEKIYDYLEPLQKDFKVPLRIGISCE